MPKNIFVYPCDSFVGKSVAKAFSAAGNAVSGLALTGASVPPAAQTVIRADDSDAAVALKQLLLTADVVVYDLLGNERATRDAVVQLAQQPYGGREVLFVAVSSPLVWAATRPSPGAVFASSTGTGTGGGEWGGGSGAAAGADDAEEGPWAGAGSGGSGPGTGSGDGEDLPEPPGDGSGSGSGRLGAGGDAVSVLGEAVEPGGGRLASAPPVAPTFRAPDDVSRRLPAAPARAALAVEQLVLRAGRRGRLRTAVVCPGLLYGEGEDDLAFCSAFKAAWNWQCLPTRGSAAAGSDPPPRLLVYGRGTNVLPTLHVADLAAYVMALAGLAPPPPPPLAPGGPQAMAAVSGVSMRGASPAVSPLPSQALSHAMGGSALGGGFGGGVSGFGGGVSGGGGGANGGYYLVTDGSRCSQGELVAAIAAAMGLRPDEGAIEYAPESELHLHPAPIRCRMLLDLSLATTPLAPLPTAPATNGPTAATPRTGAPSPAPASPSPAAAASFFQLSRPGGLPAHLADVAAEFRTRRNLTPLRLLVAGPPLSGKTHLARRLAHRYGLAYISVPLLLAAAADPRVAAAAGLNPAMDPALLRTAQAEVAAGPSATPPSSSKEKEREKDKDKEGPLPGWLPSGGRVSAKTLGALLSSALADPRAAARCRGFVLDGFPRSAAQARAAFYGLQVDEAAAAALAAELSQSQAPLRGHKSHKSLAAFPGTPTAAAAAALAAAAGHSGGGGFADMYDLPPAMKLVANPLTAPTHVIELDVGERVLRGRLAAVAAAAEEAVTRVLGEPGSQSDMDRKGPGGGTPKKATPGAGGGGKGGLAGGVVSRDLVLAATLGHNCEAGFTRRLATYSNWRAEDAADLRSRVAAAQAAWEAERVRAEADAARLAAEASTLKAKRRRARAATTMAAEANATAGAAVENDEDVATGSSPGVAAVAPAPKLPQYGGLIALSLGAGCADHIRLANPTLPEGPLVTVPVQPPPPVAIMAAGAAAASSGVAGPTSIVGAVAAASAATLAATATPPQLPHPEQAVEALLGPPHNLDGFPEPGPTPTAAAALTSEPAGVGAAAPMPTLPPPAAHKGLPLPIERNWAVAPAVTPAVIAAAAAAAAEGKQDTPRSGAAAAAAAATAAPAADSAAGGGDGSPAAAAVEAGTNASYDLRWRGSRGAAVRRYLLRHVLPVVTQALAEVALARTGTLAGTGCGGIATAAVGSAPSSGDQSSVLSPGSPSGTAGASPVAPGTPLTGALAAGLGPGSSGKEALLHVARVLAEAAEAAEAAFVDPYADPSYGIQLAKIDAKTAREAQRAAVAAAKAEREAAARQQLQQQAAKPEDEAQ